jgi:PhzF family phenazine biosynthesis protein
VTRQFRQVDVFTDTPYLGNPVAVVLGAKGLSDEQMQSFARWTNLSETTFVLPPRDRGADYWVRIFTPGGELPFAGHPTLGTCHAWLEAGGHPASPDVITQECGAGLVAIRRTEAGLAFAAPPLLRSGPVDEETTARVTKELNIARDDVVDIQWADNGPGWIAVLLSSADAVLGQAGNGGPGHRHRRPVPAGLARGAGSARVQPAGRLGGGGPGHPQP